ncbi:MAG: bifunctional riboflavin kinase/FAD synthetase [Vicinamibacteria bacterium]|nr:bifunctional riboflavin kinase/FAD synthetase [Vicinamibacteria bacterium]
MIISWLEDDAPSIENENAVVAIGNFDGVHLGHQAVLAEVVGEARRRAILACALTFEPHPLVVVTPAKAPRPLMSLTQKVECIAALGLERLFVLRFSEAAARWTPEEFSRMTLGRTVRARVVVVGERFRFGWGRGGDASVLRRLGRAHGFEVRHRSDVMIDGGAVSSTRIRALIDRGDVESACRLLGRRHFTDGTIVHGSGRGRSLGFATANVAPPKELIPAPGVYAAWCSLGDDADPQDSRRAVVNIGRRPTFDASNVTIEAHLLDFEGDLYGRSLRIEYQARLREERRFKSADRLRDQIVRDRDQAARILENG